MAPDDEGLGLGGVAGAVLLDGGLLDGGLLGDVLVGRVEGLAGGVLGGTYVGAV